MDRTGLICRNVLECPEITQRELAHELNVSLGTVNTLLKDCISKGLIVPAKASAAYELTQKGQAYLEPYQVDGAVIIAAGFGSRFVPLTFDTPKGLLEVFGERMIERQIKQLHETGISDITIVVGYLKEKFEYLIDKYNVKLLYNPEYSTKNTLTTIYRARDILLGRNMYVLASDNWMRNNMYHAYECGAWYSSVYKEGETSEWLLTATKKGLITDVRVGGENDWVMYGPAFFSREFSKLFLPALEQYYHTPGTEQFYWEQVYLEHPEKFPMYINRQPEHQVYEFENLEELRLFDPKYQTNSDNEALELVSKVFEVPESEIKDIRCLKSGMTNKSFLFQLHGNSYICRIPGPGTELLINRRQEEAAYQAVKPLNITEHLLYLNGETGYKIAEFYDDARNADPADPGDMKQCMAMLKRLHHSGLEVSHSFDIRERISFYTGLCQGRTGILFEDFNDVSLHMTELLDWLDTLDRPKVLSHIDGNVDNFLFSKDGTVRLIDWEYAGMCDPLIDIAMCSIYSYYNEDEIKQLMELYFDRPAVTREQKITYAYVALGGFLWSLWAIYKSTLGEEFGEYTIIMYRYAKKYHEKWKYL